MPDALPSGAERRRGRRGHRPAGLVRALLLVTLAAAAVSAAGCGESPEDTYYELVAAAKMGDRETFLETFTEDSRRLIEALLELSDIYGLKRDDPYKLLVHTEVVGVEEAEPEKVVGIEEPCPVVHVIVDLGHRRRKIKMIQIDGAWKIDAFDLEEFWRKRSNFTY